MGKRFKLFTNKYSDSKSGDEVIELEVSIREDLGDGTYIMETTDGKSFCLKEISKMTFLYIKDTIFFFAFLFFHLYAFYYNLYAGIFFASITAILIKVIDKIPYKVFMRTISFIYIVAIVVVTAAIFIYGSSVNPNLISFALLFGVYLLGWIYIAKFYKVYDGIYILCNDALSDWWFAPIYLLNKPKFFYWR